MQGSIRVDDKDFQEFLRAMGDKGMENLFRAQIKKAARIMQLDTVARFMRKYNYKGAWKQEIRRKSGKTKIKTRQVAKVTSKKKGGESLVKVHIMDDYRVKWLEMGTKKRHTKGHLNMGYYKLRPDAKRKFVLRVGKPGYRGFIKPGYFFKAAQARNERAMIDASKKNINEAIRQKMKHLTK